MGSETSERLPPFHAQRSGCNQLAQVRGHNQPPHYTSHNFTASLMDFTVSRTGMNSCPT